MCVAYLRHDNEYSAYSSGSDSKDREEVGGSDRGMAPGKYQPKHRQNPRSPLAKKRRYAGKENSWRWIRRGE